jgi:hypothetical protein
MIVILFWATNGNSFLKRLVGSRRNIGRSEVGR